MEGNSSVLRPLTHPTCCHQPRASTSRSWGLVNCHNADWRSLKGVPQMPLRALWHSARSTERFMPTSQLGGALDMRRERDVANQLLARALQRGEQWGLHVYWIESGSACGVILARLACPAPPGPAPDSIDLNSCISALVPSRGGDTQSRQPAPRVGQRPSEHLSAREGAVLALIAKGQSNKRVAQTLKITPETVKSHLKRVFVKLGSKTRAEAVARATEFGFLADVASLPVPSYGSASSFRGPNAPTSTRTAETRTAPAVSPC
jgi:DNA-binding CsgD family transcriptional regulator